MDLTAAGRDRWRQGLPAAIAALRVGIIVEQTTLAVAGGAQRRAAAFRRWQRDPAPRLSGSADCAADRTLRQQFQPRDRDLVRVFADENVPTYNFLVENGVEFIDKMIGPEQASTIPRTFVTVEWHVPSEIVAPRRNRNGSGLVRRLEASARKKGAQILLRHKMTRIIREQPNAGRVLGITAMAGTNPVNIKANKGVIIATGGHTGNVNFRRMFDPRLTEEYQQACEPWVHRCRWRLAAMDTSVVALGHRLQTRDGGAASQDPPHRLPLG
jgi:hypothetical protein